MGGRRSFLAGRRWLADVVIFAVSLGLAAAAGEVVLRLFFADQITIYPRYHSAATYGEYQLRRHRPNTIFHHTSVDGRWEFRINAQGFRDDRNFDQVKPQGAVRVLCLGDSQTLGFEVAQEETYAAVIQGELDRRGIKAQVINAGVSGFGTAEELVFLEQEGWKYRPDFVVLGFFANDFDDNVKSNLFVLEGQGLKAGSRSHQPGVKILAVLNAWAPLRWLSENSYLYSFALNAVWDLAKQLLLSKKQAELATEYAVAVGQTDGYERQLALRLIERLAAFCRTKGMKLIVVDIPQDEGPQDFSSSIPPEIKPAFGEVSDLFLDSEASLGALRGRVKFHAPHGQRHISAATHAVFGRAVAEWIAAQPAGRPGGGS